MNRLLTAIFALLLSFSAIAQEKATTYVNVNGAVTFDEVLLPGASARPLEAYSAYAANGAGNFNFSDATLGKLKQCEFSVTCADGKITGVFINVKDAASCRELKALVDARLGAPKTENIQKTDGKETLIVSTYEIGGRKASLSLEVGKRALLTMK